MKTLLKLTTFALLIGCSSDNLGGEVVQPQKKPKAVADFYSTDKNKDLKITDLLVNDTTQSSTIVSSVNTITTEGGSVTKNNDGSYTYTPKTNFTGSDTFKYTICNNNTTEYCSTAVVTITVKPSNVSNSSSFTIPVELSNYYNGVDFTKTGTALKDALATKVTSTHTTFLDYTPDVWNVLKQADLDPSNNTKVVLIYGYNDSDASSINDRTRDKNKNGGSTGNWNREHTYPRSLGNPNLGSSGAGSDAHHLRPSDVSFNSKRGNKKFISGTGNAGISSNGWYPGDEWKGDVARMMMYMYLRYGNQCLPKNVATGSTVSSDANMVKLLLDWNVSDPVSDLEKQRNKVVFESQGNRNPFIDNPYLATVIWGGSSAENRWQ